MKKALADLKAAIALDSTLAVARDHVRQIEPQIATTGHPAGPNAPPHGLSDQLADDPPQ
jgi:hypothetical protein